MHTWRMPCEVGVMLLQAKELPEARRDAWNRSFPSAFRRSMTLLMPWSWTSSLQHNETINFNCLNRPVVLVTAILGNNMGDGWTLANNTQPISRMTQSTLAFLAHWAGQSNKFLSQQSPYTALFWEMCLTWGWFQVFLPLGTKRCAPQLWAWWERTTGTSCS